MSCRLMALRKKARRRAAVVVEIFSFPLRLLTCSAQFDKSGQGRIFDKWFKKSTRSQCPGEFARREKNSSWPLCAKSAAGFGMSVAG
jgi:hypothetical protein